MDPVPVTLREHYGLELDPRWPKDASWRREALEAAHIEIYPQGNAFIVEEGQVDGNLLARLATVPVTLLFKSRLLNLTQDPESPPLEFKPVCLGKCRSMEETWYVWDMNLPANGALSTQGTEWLEGRAWHLTDERTVRVVSPPPVGFEGEIPIYPRGMKGWALMETNTDPVASLDPKAWLMDAPTPGSYYRIPEGRSPGWVHCLSGSFTWSDIPCPQLVLLKDGEPIETLELKGRKLQIVVSGDLGRLGWIFRSAIPLSVLAGPCGRIIPLKWQPEGKFPGIEEGIRAAIQSDAPFQVLVQGNGIPRQVIDFIPSVKTIQRPRSTTYHEILRQRAGWPAYACHQSKENHG